MQEHVHLMFRCCQSGHRHWNQIRLLDQSGPQSKHIHAIGQIQLDL